MYKLNDMMKKLVFYILIAFIASKVFTSAGFVDFANKNNTLRTLFNKNNDDKDGILTNSSFKIVPKTALHCYDLIKQSAYDKATFCYKNELVKDKNNPEIYYYLAYAYRENRNFEPAIYYANYVIKNWKDTEYAVQANKIYTGAKNDLEQKERLETRDKPDYYDEIKSPTHWGKMPITVWIEPGHNTANLLNAFSNWQNALYPVVSFHTVQKEKEADIAVIFDDPTKHCTDKNAVGCAIWRAYAHNNTEFYDAKIYLAQYDKDGTRFSDTYIYSVLCHEIGHAIGIAGAHSKNRSDVMYENEGKYNTRPTQRDIRTVMKIYGK